MNKTKLVYFACTKCASCSDHSSVIIKNDENKSAEQIKDAELLNKLGCMLDEKVSAIESNLEKMINNKLGEIAERNVTETSDNVNGSSSTNQLNYAKALAVPKELRNIIREAKNDEKVEVMEIEKRANNFIIHGAEEVGDSNEDIKQEDNQYVKDILMVLGVACEPKSVDRIGQPTENKWRPIKVIMNTKDDKMKAMNNLRRLKGEEESFGKISITDDYTSSEQEEIKRWFRKAQEKSSENPEKIFKVRGDPKNGLRLVGFTRQQ